MTFLHLFATTACLLTAFVSATTSVDDSIAQEAIESQAAHYKTLRKDYKEAGCKKSWGEFPTRKNKANTKPWLTSKSVDLSGGKICSCGMIYDLASSALGLFREAEETTAGGMDAIYIDGEISTSTSTSKLESVIMARTPNSQAPCSGGFADGWPCKNVDLIAHFPLSSFEATDTGKAPSSANDLWGWTHAPSDREFVIFGVRQGHYFFEVTGFDPVLMGYLPPTDGRGALQGDVKVINDYAYLGSEALNHGLQIFDMKRLLDVNPLTDCVNEKYCQELTTDGLYRGTSTFPIRNSHNVVVNPDNPNNVYVVGAGFGFFFENCRAGLHVVDVSDPNNPTTAGCFRGDGYVHDAQCVNYNGPDPNYSNNNSEICFCFNEDTVTIVDVTDKSNMSIIAKINYGNVGYTHQGWLSSDHKYIVFGDETDEFFGGVDKTRTLVVNVEDLKNPGTVLEYFGPTAAIDHNLYIIKATAEGQDYDEAVYGDTDLIYEANYASGMRILQVIDYETANFEEVGYFDTFPPNDGSNFVGAWSSYPFFKSGLVAISSLEEGLFLVKPNIESSLIPPSEINCSDDTSFTFRNKDCEFVANTKNVAKNCERTVGGRKVWNICRETCGKAGVGICKDEFNASE